MEEKEEEKSIVRGNMCDLPSDIHRLISSFLYGGDSIIFRRCISKSLTSSLVSSSISQQMMMMNIESRPLPQFPELPYLLSLQDNVLKFHHPLLSGCHSVQIPQLSESFIRFSNHGWLLMQNDTKGIVFFFEPFSRQKIVLPHYPAYFDFDVVCFNLPPTSPDCFVVALSFSSDTYCTIRRGEECWFSDDLIDNEFYFSLGIAPVMRDDGSCYLLGFHGDLGVLNPQENPNSWTNLGGRFSKKIENSVRQCFLLEKSEEELMRVLVLGKNRRIKFSTFNIRTKTWSNSESSLGDKVLFLSTKGSFSESSHLRGMHNKVYFPKFHNDANIFYSLSEKRYISFHGDYSSESCGRDVRDLSFKSIWFKPVFSDTTFCGQSQIKWEIL